MEMDMEPMNMAEHAMHSANQEQPSGTPCDNCEHHEAELAVMTSPTHVAYVAAQVPFAVFSHPVNQEEFSLQPSQSFLANGPPFWTTTLVSTVVMRT